MENDSALSSTKKHLMNFFLDAFGRRRHSESGRSRRRRSSRMTASSSGSAASGASGSPSASSTEELDEGGVHGEPVDCPPPPPASNSTVHHSHAPGHPKASCPLLGNECGPPLEMADLMHRASPSALPPPETAFNDDVKIKMSDDVLVDIEEECDAEDAEEVEQRLVNMASALAGSLTVSGDSDVYLEASVVPVDSGPQLNPAFELTDSDGEHPSHHSSSSTLTPTKSGYSLPFNRGPLRHSMAGPPPMPSKSPPPLSPRPRSTSPRRPRSFLSLGRRRNKHFGYKQHADDEDAIAAAAMGPLRGPLPLNSKSFLRPPPSPPPTPAPLPDVEAAYDRSSMVEPLPHPEGLDGYRRSREAVRPHSVAYTGTRPTSWSSGGTDIDWSWVHDEEEDDHGADADVSQEEPQSPSTPAVPPLPSAAACTSPDTGTSWSYEADVEEDDASPGVSRPGRSNWLRASMRRVRHFRLGPAPSHRRSAPPNVLPHLPPATAAVLLTASPIHQQSGRPLSAPARQEERPSVRDATTSTSSCRGSCPVSRTGSRTASRQSTRPPSRTPSRPPSRPVSTASQPQPEPQSDPPPYSRETTSTSTDAQQTSSQDSDNDNRSCADSSPMTDSSNSIPLGRWPHNLSSTLACLGCTLGLFNMSRFALLSVQFGANFIIQFLLLSAVFGVPLYTFQVCLGQFLNAGAVDMWRISPIFQGIGIALLVSQALLGVYSVVGVSWIFIYFRDSFITKLDRYRWAEPFEPYREDPRLGYNTTHRIEFTVPDYFNGVVLQRHNLASPENSFGHIKFQVAFNLAVVWMIVFVSLSKGLRSYGKVVYMFSIVPVFGMLVLCTKMLGLMPRDSKHQVFPETEWTEFFINSKSWVAATSEVLLTWGLLGTAAMQIASHNKQKQMLQRDTSLVVIFTVSMLLLSAFLANTCVSLLLSNGYIYLPSSFEHLQSSQFLYRYQAPLAYATTPVRWLPHTSYVMGERVARPNMSPVHDSGYQALRLATELMPSTLALLGADQVSPFWAVLFYFVLILFGIAQQLAIWHCVITGIMAINAPSLKCWETTITFFSCACGFILGLPMTTELGIFVVYFLDFCVGSGWWLMVLYLMQVGAVLIVRGRPYSGESIAATLFNKSHACLLIWAAPMLTFTWNVILPVILMVVCITVFKNSGSRELYSWHASTGYDYWPLWSREVGAMLQLLPIVAIPAVGFIQSCRYLSAGPPDLFDRIQLLYRPPMGSHNTLQDLSTQTDPAPGEGGVGSGTSVNPVLEDPPPKYSPPPSYTTATGARIAKLLRQSFRRSVRRIHQAISNETVAEPSSRPLSTNIGVCTGTGTGAGTVTVTVTATGGLATLSECSGLGSATVIAGPSALTSIPATTTTNTTTTSTTDAPEHPPPDYAAVLVEMNRAMTQPARSDISIVISDDGPNSTSGDKSDFIRPVASATTHQRTQSSNLTAADVAQILRSSVRRVNSAVRNSAGTISPSAERLVDSAEPMSEQEPATVGVTVVGHSQSSYSHC